MRKLFAPAVSQKEALTLYGRKHFLAKIHDYMTDRQMPENVALLGVKGAGKSSVIRKAFGREENRRYYDEADIVVTFVSIPETTDSMKGFYSYLNTSVLEALDAVEEYDAGRYHALMEQIAQKKNQILARCVEVDDATMESVLNKTIGLIRDAGIKLLIVFDDFERFADSSRLKKAQYRYMRELANSGKISLFIATGQDLTKVSEEMKGSGFENIFTYEELRGIRLSDIEDWISDVMDGTDVEIDDEVTDWIGEISGGIPEIAAEAAELSCRLLAKGQNFDGNDWCKKLYPAVSPLMKTWWNYTDEAEHRIFADLIAGTSADSVNRDCLVKKGYLDETDFGEVVFTTPLFEMYVLGELENREQAEAAGITGDAENLRTLLWEIVREANGTMEEKIERMDSRISDITDRLSAILCELPSKEDFYTRENGELDPDRYGEAIAAYISDKLTETNDDELCAAWNIDADTWHSFSDIRKNDCAMAYRLITFIFTEDIPGLDYTPVTVMLGNFLEGLLNDKVLRTLKQSLPDARVKMRHGGYGALKDYRGTMTIGGFVFLFRNEDVAGAIGRMAKGPRPDARQMDDFSRKLSECHRIRNKADHPGEITTAEDKSRFVADLFLGQNSMLRVMCGLELIA
ncbi:MAG: ATP-binding protein [Roseburia sp.]|jgi:hypothetical protein|nr:ATP-binding protein [Roseburia sp.]